jgi:hypothetical protein
VILRIPGLALILIKPEFLSCREHWLWLCREQVFIVRIIGNKYVVWQGAEYVTVTAGGAYNYH